MSTKYDPKWAEHHFDQYGDREWNRLVSDPENEVKLYIHRHYLEKYIRSADHVLEIGAAAGRFTQILVELGALVLVTDISSVQLELNQKYADKYGFDQGVQDRLKLDMCDMSVLGDAAFDNVVCYGGPLSYVFDKAGQALHEIHRVLKPSGLAFVSVMSLWGSAHRFLEGTLKLPAEVSRPIIRTGDHCLENYPEYRHDCHMFRAVELQKLLEINQFTVLEMSASNCVFILPDERLKQIRNDPTQWQAFLDMELEACREPGCLDMGTHIIAVAQKVAQEKTSNHDT